MAMIDVGRNIGCIADVMLSTPRLPDAALVAGSGVVREARRSPPNKNPNRNCDWGAILPRISAFK
jgi:hypothetical protein